MKELFDGNGWLVTALSLLGIGTIANGIWTVIIRKAFYKREDTANLSKTEQEASRQKVERYLVELDINKIIEEKVKLVRDEYKDKMFEMIDEHFEVKREIQQRLEKEMKRRAEVEQDNELLRNELHEMREKIEGLEEKVETLENNKK